MYLFESNIGVKVMKDAKANDDIEHLVGEIKVVGIHDLKLKLIFRKTSVCRSSFCVLNEHLRNVDTIDFGTSPQVF